MKVKFINIWKRQIGHCFIDFLNISWDPKATMIVFFNFAVIIERYEDEKEEF